MWRNGKGPFIPVMAYEPFMKWGLNLMGPIKPTTNITNNQYIIVAIDYTTKWMEVKALKDNTTKKLLNSFMRT